MVSKTKTDSYKSLTDSQTITNPAKILRLLERFTKGYNPLTVQISGHKALHTSSIVSVNKEQILFDELLPSSGHQLLMTERALQATGKLEGVDVQFATSLKHVDDKDNTLSYYMKLPEIIEYRQRRLNYRVHIPVTLQLSVTIENREGNKIKGALRDLSYGGVGIIILANKTLIQTGEEHECIIELPDGEKICCTAELRYSRNIPSQRTQLIGVQFIGLLPEQSRHIGQCINELERKFIKKRADFK
jgi:c-di-GMP-binding flagellar brake protein YcgR